MGALTLVLAVLLTWCAGSLSWIFFNILTDYVLWAEPNTIWLIFELALAILFALVGLSGIGIALKVLTADKKYKP